MPAQKSKHFLFHYLLKELKLLNIKNKHLLVGVSGGIDSMTLLLVLWELKQVLNLKISVVHVHHGSKDQKQKKFQDKAALAVKNFYNSLCDNHLNSQGVYIFKPEVLSANKKSRKTGAHEAGGKAGPHLLDAGNEAQMRKYRYQVFSHFMKKSCADFLVLAHTADDLLETRLIRLIRGTGPQGLTAMSFKKVHLLRPFIQINRSQVMDYAKSQKIKWCEDPTNKSVSYSFRNWIRHKWLPTLENKRLGAVKSLGRSLDLLAQEAASQSHKTKKMYQLVITNQSLKRDLILLLPLSDRKTILAYYLKQQGFKNYRASHIIELLKQLNRPQKNFTFSLLNREWKMTRLKLTLSKTNKPMKKER